MHLKFEEIGEILREMVRDGEDSQEVYEKKRLREGGVCGEFGRMEG